MKQRLTTAVQQQLVLTPQLRLAIRLLQLSATELEAEVAEAVASNPLLDWNEDSAPDASPAEPTPPSTATGEEDRAAASEPAPDWEHDPWPERGGGGAGLDEALQPAVEETLHDHLLWQLHLGHFSPRDARIGIALIDAIDDDGYLREDLEALAASLRPELDVRGDELQSVLHRIQYFDPIGVGARSASECLRVQLRALSADTPGRAQALALTGEALERLPRIGIAGVAALLRCDEDEARTAIGLLQSLDPRPGARYGGLPADNYLRPDCIIRQRQGAWQVTLAPDAQPRVGLQRDYERLSRSSSGADGDYLRRNLQEARWLLKALASRADTLLRVTRCLVRQQAGFLEFGPQALHPLTLRDVADELGIHESTVSRTVAGKYALTPRGTLPLRTFFASGIDTGGGGSASSTAIQDMLRKLIANEDPRRPLSDARLADTLKAEGIPVARRTVAKYREALNIPASHERVRMDTAGAPAPRPSGPRPTVEGGQDAD